MTEIEIVWASPHMAAAVEMAIEFAQVCSPVLIEGESGTGKELIARLIHRQSPRAGKAFVPVNCAAIPESLFESEFFGYRAGAFTGAIRDKVGLFEAASGGTLFLDEIADLPPAMQAKCLRVLQESHIRRIGETRIRKADFRLVSATNRNLEEEMRAGRFREDLFFRISVLRIHLEPLRNRPEDIVLLLEHFTSKYSRLLKKPRPRLSDGILEVFRAYDWPGNVRELENEVHRLVAMAKDGKPLGVEQVSRRILDNMGGRAAGSRGSLREKVRAYERRLIMEALECYGWNKARVAKYLGLTRQGLYKKMQRLEITRDD